MSETLSNVNCNVHSKRRHHVFEASSAELVAHREHHTYNNVVTIRIEEPNFVMLGDKVVRFQTAFPRTLLSTARTNAALAEPSANLHNTSYRCMTARTVYASVDYHFH